MKSMVAWNNSWKKRLIAEVVYEDLWENELYLDYDDDMSVYIYLTIHLKYMHFIVWKLYPTKLTFKIILA